MIESEPSWLPEALKPIFLSLSQVYPPQRWPMWVWRALAEDSLSIWCVNSVHQRALPRPRQTLPGVLPSPHRAAVTMPNMHSCSPSAARTLQEPDGRQSETRVTVRWSSHMLLGKVTCFLKTPVSFLKIKWDNATSPGYFWQLFVIFFFPSNQLPFRVKGLFLLVSTRKLGKSCPALGQVASHLPPCFRSAWGKSFLSTASTVDRKAGRKTSQGAGVVLSLEVGLTLGRSAWGPSF